MAHRTNVYEYGDRWGWDCDDCTEAEAGFVHAATAQGAADVHQDRTEES